MKAPLPALRSAILRLCRRCAPPPARLWLLAGGIAALGPATMQAELLEAAPPGIIENGTTAFVVLGPESLGLSAPPTDLRQMPDGRILVVARSELALGDGVRWEVYRQAESDHRHDTISVAVDADGKIYAGVQDGFGRVDFGHDGRWRLTPVAPLPATATPVLRPVLTHVTTTPTGWYWHCGSGAVIAWQPGEAARLVGSTSGIERVFTFGSAVFISDRADGSLLRAADNHATAIITAGQTTPNHTITCGTPLSTTQLLVGTNADGLKLFDGRTFTPFPTPGLPPGIRVNDLCATAGGHFAAAIDNTGIVFFDATGRIVQTLDRNLDHRLSRAQRLIYSAGTLWALLNEGIARIRFPSRLSTFEPLVATGLTFAQPLRHDGRLWLLADGRAQRGVYSPEHRLLHFADDSPPGSFTYSLSTQFGRLLAANDTGIYGRRGEHWELLVPGICNARVEVPSADGTRWLYVARGELGWLTPEGDTVRADRFPHPELGDIYGVATDSAHRVWLELGSGAIGCVLLDGTQPRLEILGAADGVPAGWVNTFILDGRVYFNIANRLFHFDNTRQRLAEETALLQRYPLLAGLVGRPRRDSAGRLWMTANGAVHALTGTSSLLHDETIHAGCLPSLFTAEQSGVVWMHESRRLARYDPAVPEPPPAQVRAIITQVHLTTSDRHLLNTGSLLSPLPFADNSLVVHYLAPGTPFGQSVSFEVKLDGAGGEWVSTSSTGSTAFNRLKEGHYTLRVRPQIGSTRGVEASLDFRIRPPWYRTPLAYLLYAAATVALVLGCAWWLSFLERREKARLEYLVSQRTGELHDANARLARQVHETLDKAAALVSSEERYRRLNETLERRVQERTAELTASNRELESFSYSISHDLRAPLRNISGFADLLRRRLHNADTEGERFLNIIATESVRLGQLIDALLVFSRLGRSELKLQPVDLAHLVDAARSELATELGHRAVEFRIGPLPTVLADPTLLRQVFANLLSNALKFTRSRSPALIEIGVAPGATGSEAVVFIRDNGVGFDPKYSEKLFGVFQRLHHAREFEGTGIGLANVRRIIARHSGRVWAEGCVGEGATFFVALPTAPSPTAT